MKKLTFLVALLVVLAGFAISVQAETEKSYGQLLQEIGLIKGSDKGLQEDKEITREEMVTILVRLESDKQGYESFVAPQNPSFKDVPASHWAYRDIEYAYKKGLTGGIGEGKFGLKKRITYDQASLFLLRSLGYDGKEIHFAHAAKEIADKYDLRLQNREVGKAFLKRDQVFELMAKALSMKPKTATGFAKLHTIDLDWPKVDKWLEEVKKASPRPNKKNMHRYVMNDFKIVDASLVPRNLLNQETGESYEFYKDALDTMQQNEKKMKEFISKYLSGKYKVLEPTTKSLDIKKVEHGLTDGIYENSNIMILNDKLYAEPTTVYIYIDDEFADEVGYDVAGPGRASGKMKIEEIRRYEDKNGYRVYAVFGIEDFYSYSKGEYEKIYNYIAFTVDKSGKIVETIGSSVYGTGYGKKEVETNDRSKGSEF